MICRRIFDHFNSLIIYITSSNNHINQFTVEKIGILDGHMVNNEFVPSRGEFHMRGSNKSHVVVRGVTNRA